MRVDPAEKIVRSAKLKEENQLKIDKVTRIVALVVAFISVFFFIIKIMFL